MTDIKWLADYLADASMHFAFSAIVGLLACLPILTTLFVCYSSWARGGRRRMSTVAVCGIVCILLLVGGGAALATHAALDGYAEFYTTPLGPPLKIDTGGANF